jgi:hypothetical protein
VDIDTLNTPVTEAIWRAQELDALGIQTGNLSPRGRRAQSLCDAYLADGGAPTFLKTSLQEILEEADQEISNRFQQAAKHHTPREARDLARRFSDAGAFNLAA